MNAGGPHRVTLDSCLHGIITSTNSVQFVSYTLLLNKNYVIMDHTTKIKKCGSLLCRTCPFVEELNFFTSNVTGEKFIPKTNDKNYLDCRSENIIYLIYCKVCNFQYIGETKNKLQKRFSNHKSSIKSGTSCQLVHQHFQADCHGLMNCKVIPIEKIDTRPLNQQNLNQNQLETAISKLRFEREKHWISSLQTTYPFGLNSRLKGVGDYAPSQNAYPNFGGRRRRRNKKHSRRKPKRLRIKHDISLDFIKRRHQELADSQNYVHFFKSFLYGLPRSDLQKLSNDALNPLIDLDMRLKDMITLITQQRLFNPVQIRRINKEFFHLPFRDKGLDFINLSGIMRSHSVQAQIPVYFVEKDPPILGYKFNKSIAGMVLNYKQTLSEESLQQIDNNPTPCDCHLSTLKDPYHNHIITGNLDIIKNSTLKKLFEKGPKYRLPQRIEWRKDKTVIENFIDNYIDKWIAKEKKNPANQNVHRNLLNGWRKNILELVDNRIEAGKMKFRKTWSVKIEGNVKAELERLKEHYVITVADKAQNNLLFTCKKYYVAKLREELTRPGQQTYIHVRTAANTINDNIVQFSALKNIKVPDTMKEIPSIYWIPKMHKNPIGSRFIAGSKICALKPISKAFSRALKLILNHMRLYSNTVLERTNLNYFWIIDNSLNFMDKVKDKNLQHMQTYDFSTLYTALPHSEIKNKFKKIFQKVYDREAKPYINVNAVKAYFSASKSSNSCSFRVSDMMEVLDFILDNIFVKCGEDIFKQVIGIPIGLDSGQDIANLLLFCYESTYVEKISKQDMTLARKFSLCSRYIDDLFVGNFPSFREHIYKIYPRELEIKPESNNPMEVAFLDLKINYTNSQINFSIYDKRDDFNFNIVNFPYMDSCIPKKSALGVFYSQLIRYMRLNSNYPGFKERCKLLTNKLLNQGYLHNDLKRRALRFFQENRDSLQKYNLRNSGSFVKDIF